MSWRPLADVVRPLAAATPRTAPTEVAEEAAEVVDPVTTTEEGSDAGAERGPAGAAAVAEGMVAMTRRLNSEGVGEGDMAETGGGTYGTGGPTLAAPTKLSTCGPRMCANHAAQRRVVGSSGSLSGARPAMDGYTTPGICCCTAPAPPTTCPNATPLESLLKIAPIGGRGSDPACRSTCAATAANACSPGDL